MAQLDGLAWLLRTNVVTLHAYHAADVCARLACINFTTLIYDMATAVRVYEKRDLV